MVASDPSNHLDPAQTRGFQSNLILREPGAFITQGVKYAGAKTRLISAILDHIDAPHGARIIDAFSGTTRVSQALAKCHYAVISNDISEWSECFAKAFLLGSLSSTNFQEIIEHLNNQHPIDGWFTDTYGGSNDATSPVERDGTRRIWQRHNSMRIDAIRAEIDTLNLSDIDKSVCLTSLILAADKVDSTVGHYASYLRDWAPRSYNSLKLEVPKLCPPTTACHEVTRCDARDALAQSISCYATYLDPPYGSNNDKMPASRVRYASYYHIWKTLILNDRPEITGKAQRRADCSDNLVRNPYEDFRRDFDGDLVAKKALATTIGEVKSDILVLSYSSEGRVPFNDVFDILSEWGSRVTISEVDHKRNVMSTMHWTGQWRPDNPKKLTEYLFRAERR